MDIAYLNANVPENIKRIITEKGLKRCVVAKKAGCTSQMFSDILAGRRLIKASEIAGIAKTLDVTPNDLFINPDQPA